MTQDSRNGVLRDIALITFFYCLSHGLLLLNAGIYWDDWTLYRVPAADVLDTYRQNGLPALGYLHAYLLGHENFTLWYRAITFCSYYFSALFFYLTLRSLDELPGEANFFTALLFAIVPFNVARVALINTPYAICYLLFFLGFYLCARHLERKSLLLRVLALCAFFASFTTNSLLFFFALVLLYIVYKEGAHRDLKRAFGSLARHADFLCLPVLYWIVKKVYFTPYRLYSGYNSISLKNVVLFPVRAVTVLGETCSGLAYQGYQLFGNTGCVLLLAALFVLVLLLAPKRGGLSAGTRKDSLFFLIGLLLVLCAAFPYVAVGKMPSLNDWNSRHQLLMPLGFALMAVAGSARLFEDGGKARCFLAFFAAFCVAANVWHYLAFELDWAKQVGMVGSVKACQVVRDNTTFLFQDDAVELNANRRRYRFYEMNAFMKAAYGTQTRLADDYAAPLDLKGAGKIKSVSTNSYSLADYTPAKPEYLLIITRGSAPGGALSAGKLMYRRLFDEKAYLDSAGKMVRLTAVKLPEPCQSEGVQ